MVAERWLLQEEEDLVVYKVPLSGLFKVPTMEMDSHGGLEVTIRQTESKKKTTQLLRETDP